jgi:hypothetical protein
MFNRRALLASVVLLSAAGSCRTLAVPAPWAIESDPAAVIRAIYRCAVRGAGPSWIDAADRPKDLSRSLVALWAKTDAARPRDDELGPVDFDLVADTNGLTLTTFSVAVEQRDARAARVAVTLGYKEQAGRKTPTVLHYAMLREDGGWKINDIVAADWSARGLLASYLSRVPRNPDDPVRILQPIVDVQVRFRLPSPGRGGG